MFLWFSGLTVPLLIAAFAAHYLHARTALLEALDTSMAEHTADLGFEADQDLRNEASTMRHGVGSLVGFDIYELPDYLLVARSASLSPPCAPLPAERVAELRGRSRIGPGYFAASTKLPGGHRARVCGTVFGSAARDRLVVVYGELSEVDDELQTVLAGYTLALPVVLSVAFAAAWIASRQFAVPLCRKAADADDAERDRIA